MAAQEAARRPAAQPKQAFALVQDIWGLKLNPQRIRSLASYDDQNFLFEELPSSEHGQEEPRRQRRFVFKIFSSSITPEVLACQHEVMQRCHDQGVLCGLPILTLAGSGTAKVRLGDAEWACRLMHYCEGKVFAETLHTEELLQTIGEQAALIGIAMLDVEIPAAHRKHDWDMNCAFRAIEKYRPSVSPERLPLLDRHLDYFREHCAAQLERQRDCIIHGDLNDHNLIVGDAEAEGDSRLLGVIDFGEVHHSKLLYEMAICLAYLMLDKEKPFTAAAHVLRGYRSKLELTPEELWLLLPCAMLRLVTSFMASSYFNQLEPDNEYILVTAEPGWKLLSMVGGGDCYPSIEEAHAAFNKECGIPPLSRPGEPGDFEQVADR